MSNFSSTGLSRYSYSILLCVTADSDSSTGDNESSDDSDGLSGGAIAGIVIGIIAGLVIGALLVVGIVYFIKKRPGTTSKYTRTEDT